VDFNQNYFQIFGLPEKFQVDPELLRNRYLELQKEVHPDNFASSTDHEQRLSVQWATLINTANETLKAPLSRAVYMLELRGVDIAHNPVLPPEFLMEQIELREELEDIEDDASLEKLDEFRLRLMNEMKLIEDLFGDVVDANEEKAEIALYELQFLNKLKIAADHLEEKLLDY
jgi:molecular chaperone HscB